MLLEQRHLDMDALDEEERQIHLRQQELARFIDGRDKGGGEDGKDDTEKDEKDGESPNDLFEETKLLGTHRGTFRTDEGLNSRHNASVTYDARNGRYYVMLLASSSRHVAVISDLHRFGEHFTDKPAPEAACNGRRRRRCR